MRECLFFLKGISFCNWPTNQITTKNDECVHLRNVSGIDYCCCLLQHTWSLDLFPGEDARCDSRTSQRSLSPLSVGPVPRSKHLSFPFSFFDVCPGLNFFPFLVDDFHVWSFLIFLIFVSSLVLGYFPFLLLLLFYCVCRLSCFYLMILLLVVSFLPKSWLHLFQRGRF